MILISSLALLTSCGKKEIKKYSIKDFLETTNYYRASFSPDNSKILLSSNETGIFNAFALPVDGGKGVQLTNSTDESIIVECYFPEDERFLYSSDKGGNELDHVFVKELDGSVRDLTPGEELKAQYYVWANDDKSFYIGTNERDKRFFDVYEYSVSGYDREMIYENNEGYTFAGVSPDKRFIALMKTETRNNSDIFLFDSKTNETQNITPHEGDIRYAFEDFSPDGEDLYYTTDENSEFMYLKKMNLETKESELVEKVDWDIAYAYFTKRGKYLVVAVNNDAKTELKVYNPDTMEKLKLPELPNSEISNVYFSDDEEHMAFYASSGKHPRDLFYMKLTDDSPRQLTSSLNPNIDPEDLVEGEVVRFKSFDELEIPGILYKPHQASADNMVPALVWVHGGPGGQSRIGYRALIQYLVNHGYAVYAINNRGSSGYGKTFEGLDNRAHGEGDLDDCVWSKKMLAGTGYVYENRIGIIGGSYGGYMVLAALAFRPEEFNVGVDIFGVSNWVRTLQSIPPWWESIRNMLEKEMGDFDDEEYLKKFSPLFHADKITKPLIVLQGANDPRVLKVESDEIVEAVRNNGVPVEYVVFDDEGHGFMKKENEQKGYEAILEFLNKHL
jgi:dipeptidyl aminopeptidase/acylaminoacyl peptidase